MVELYEVKSVFLAMVFFLLGKNFLSLALFKIKVEGKNVKLYDKLSNNVLLPVFFKKKLNFFLLS